MMKSDKTIIFILYSIEQQRCHKRINEFIDHGYQVKVYAFSRKLSCKKCNYTGYDVEVIGEFSNTVSYFKRIGIIRKGIKMVMKENRRYNGIFYLFNLDIASIAYWMIDKPYIYEESDLTHTYISNVLLRKGLDVLDKHIINRSLQTVFTSEGFVKYHFKEFHPNNIWVIPNRLNPQVQEYPLIPKRKLMLEHIHFGFVGKIRGKALANFTKVIAEYFPQHEMHFFGGCDDCNLPVFEPFRKYKNIFFHGPFLNPQDLGKVYSQVDIVISTYDAHFDNVLYAEPNKIYEAIYFETPILVSVGTFLAEKVSKLGIGFDVDALNDEAVCRLVNGLTAEKIKDKVQHAASIDKKTTINENGHFFVKLKKLLA